MILNKQNAVRWVTLFFKNTLEITSSFNRRLLRQGRGWESAEHGATQVLRPALSRLLATLSKHSSQFLGHLNSYRGSRQLHGDPTGRPTGPYLQPLPGIPIKALKKQ